MAITLNGTTGITTPGLSADSPTLTVDSANNRVGIGITNSLSKLHIVSEEIGNGSNRGFRIDNWSSTKSYSIRTGITGIENTSLSIYDETLGSNRLVISTAGNVGIGTDTPSQKLNIVGNIMLDGSDQYMYLSNVGIGNAGMYVRGRVSTGELRSHSTGIFTWEVTGSEKLRITSDGQLRSQATYNGSATTSNAFPCLNLNNLQGVYTSGNIIGGVTFGKSPGHSAGIRAGMIALYSSTNSLADNIGTELIFRTATENSGDSGERLRIDSSGNVGIGTNDPSAKLDVNGVLKCGPGIAPFISAVFRDYNDGSAIYASVVQAGGGKFISGESYYFNSGFWRSDKTTSTAIGLDSGDIRFLTRSGLTANTDFNGPIERLRITSSGIVNSTNYSFNGVGTNNATNVYLGAYAPGGNAYAIATLGVERLLIASDGRVIQDGVITWSTSGYANLNSTFSYDISVRDDSGSGQGSLHKIYAGINHFNFSSYGTVLEQWVSTRGTSTTEALTTHYVTSGQGGSWSVSKPSNNVLRITHNGGSLNAFGWFFIKVFSVE